MKRSSQAPDAENDLLQRKLCYYIYRNLWNIKEKHQKVGPNSQHPIKSKTQSPGTGQSAEEKQHKKMIKMKNIRIENGEMNDIQGEGHQGIYIGEVSLPWNPDLVWNKYTKQTY